MVLKQKLLHIYDTQYKKLLIIPLVILAFSILIILLHYVKTGEFVDKGVSLKGGSTITIQLDEKIEPEKIRGQLAAQFNADFLIRKLSVAGEQIGLTIESSAEDPTAIVEFLKSSLKIKSIAVEITGTATGKEFFRQVLLSVIFAFILMSLVVFAYFRILIPSLYIILAAAADIIFAWSMIVLLDVKLSTAGVAAFLMLIGYSVDTDILLTTRVLKREGNLNEKIIGAMSTGIVMTFAAIVATGVAYIATPSEVLKQIMLILFFGLIADLWNTWLQNAPLLRIYVEKRNKVTEHGS